MARPRRDPFPAAGAGIGGLAGLIGGVILGAPFGPVGLGVGGFLGFITGLAVGALLGWITSRFFQPEGPEWTYATPSFTSLSLSARPNPAQRGSPCSLTVHWTVSGNDDLALCSITTRLFRAEEGVPPTPPSFAPIRNNASTFGRASPPFQTVWSDEHDGRLVETEIRMVVEKDGKSIVVSGTVPSIRVPVVGP